MLSHNTRTLASAAAQGGGGTVAVAGDWCGGDDAHERGRREGEDTGDLGVLPIQFGECGGG